MVRPGAPHSQESGAASNPVSPEGRKVLDHICENYAVESLGTIDEYRTALAATGFVDADIRDISANIDRTLGLMADTVETVPDELIALVGEEQAASLIDFMRLSGATPESGYVYLTAVRG